eukprot:gnl/MRDRNA2_/MRDRNA2_59996_c0_seq1.p1 gnl/MRDRNA2_/MRDRNA2_59996_c0~~gnl/MRDRNA2_/MRDRNA2_59996_c0_seq1.p1  ORF type:complete len:133 (-),score=25.85 gnl/MRDRNA2_/MRDRNA2_59996_c0_seq1:249-647(-)
MRLLLFVFGWFIVSCTCQGDGKMKPKVKKGGGKKGSGKQKQKMKQMLTKIFSLLDADANGKATQEEVADMREQLQKKLDGGEEMTKEEKILQKRLSNEKVWSEYWVRRDHDKDNQLTLKEYVTSIKRGSREL